jgi:prepilin-type N-terminal cleavage/methylation domain-containing protein
MFERIKKARQQGQEREGGFTLIELLVVIAILGILAAIVVFSVAGVTDKGQLASCKIDTQTIRTAEEANFAAPTTSGGGVYVAMATLVTDGFLSTTSTLHGVTLVPAAGANPASYYVTESSTTCGVNGDSVGAAPAGAVSPPPTLACTTGGAPGATGWGDC